MKNYGNFAFGNPVLKVEQKDKSPKKVFVLGVYASAVHARWKSSDGKSTIKALAVASEPYIFWRGDCADEIISQIHIPPEAGELKAADERFNGPSGLTLDDCILKPLGFTRDEVWLCDLVPYSLKNKRQEEALMRLEPILKKYNLPIDTRMNDTSRKIDSNRVEEILEEIKNSGAELIITLGNEPIKYFINHFNKSINPLSHQTYGKIYDMILGNHHLRLLPLVHPRHIKAMIGSSKQWTDTHKDWLEKIYNKT